MVFWSQVWELGHRHVSRPHWHRANRGTKSKPDTRAAFVYNAFGNLACHSHIQPRQPSLDHDDIFFDLLDRCPAIKAGKRF